MKHFALAIALSFLTPIAVFAAGAPQMCIPVSEAKDIATKQHATWTELTPDQWQFMRGVYMLLPTTPPGLPYGNHAVLVTQGDNGLVMFIDGDKACTPVPVPKAMLEVLADVKSKNIHHRGVAL